MDLFKVLGHLPELDIELKERELNNLERNGIVVYLNLSYVKKPVVKVKSDSDLVIKQLRRHKNSFVKRTHLKDFRSWAVLAEEDKTEKDLVMDKGYAHLIEPKKVGTVKVEDKVYTLWTVLTAPISTIIKQNIYQNREAKLIL